MKIIDAYSPPIFASILTQLLIDILNNSNKLYLKNFLFIKTIKLFDISKI